MSEVPTNSEGNGSILDAEEEKVLHSMPRRTRRYSPFTALPPDELIRDEHGGSFSDKTMSINIKTAMRTPISAPTAPSFGSQEDVFNDMQSPKSAKIDKFTNNSVDEETSTDDYQTQDSETSLPVEGHQEHQEHQEGDQTTPQDGTPLLTPFTQLIHKTPYAHITDLVTNSLSKVEKRAKHLSCNSVMEFSDLLKQAGVEMEDLQDDKDGGIEYTKDVNDLSNENFENLTPSKSSVGTMSEYDSEPEFSTPASDHEEETQEFENEPVEQPKQPARLSMGRFLEPSRITCTIDDEGNVHQSSSSSPQVLLNNGEVDSPPNGSPTSPMTRRASMKRKKSIRGEFMKGGRYGTVPKDFFTTLFKRGDSKEFGVELNTVMSRKSELGHEIPAIIEEMMVVISEKMNVEGLFRIGGNVKEMEALIKKMDGGKVVDLRTLNIHVITGLTKKYIRQAKLLTPESFEVFKKVLQMDKEEEILKELSRLFSDVSLIPYYNCLLLNRLLQLLYNIHRKSDVNQMTAHNLAIIFAPNLFQDGSTSLSNNLVLQTKGTKIIALMIEKYDEVFKPLFQKLKERNDLKPEKVKQHGLIDESQILMKGYVSKRTKVKSWKRRYAVLTDSQFLLFEDEDICKKKLDSQFDFGKDVMLVDYPKKEFSFKIYKIRVEEDDIKEWAIRAENENDKQEWMKRIEKIVERFKSTPNKF